MTNYAYDKLNQDIEELKLDILACKRKAKELMRAPLPHDEKNFLIAEYEEFIYDRTNDLNYLIALQSCATETKEKT